jgi:hypothetical protein
MEPQTVRQVEGAVELLNDATTGGSRAIAGAQAEIAAVPYTVLKRLPGIGRVAAVIERSQATITRGVYWSVRTISGISAAAATVVVREIARRTPEQ